GVRRCGHRREDRARRPGPAVASHRPRGRERVVPLRAPDRRQDPALPPGDRGDRPTRQSGPRRPPGGAAIRRPSPAAGGTGIARGVVPARVAALTASVVPGGAGSESQGPRRGEPRTGLSATPDVPTGTATATTAVTGPSYRPRRHAARG